MVSAGHAASVARILPEERTGKGREGGGGDFMKVDSALEKCLLHVGAGVSGKQIRLPPLQMNQAAGRPRSAGLS